LAGRILKLPGIIGHFWRIEQDAFCFGAVQNIGVGFATDL